MAKPRSFPPVGPGQWVQPVRKQYGMACCDCGLVHRMDFRILKWGRGHKIQFRSFRDERSTKTMRRRKKGTQP